MAARLRAPLIEGSPLIRTSLGVLDRATGAAGLLETAMPGAMLSANAASNGRVAAAEKYGSTSEVGVYDVSSWLGTGRDKRTATVVGSLSGYHTNPILTITATPDGGKPTVIAQGPVADDNTLTVTYPMKRATTFTVSHAGDDWYTPAEASTRLLPR